MGGLAPDHNHAPRKEKITSVHGNGLNVSPLAKYWTRKSELQYEAFMPLHAPIKYRCPNKINDLIRHTYRRWTIGWGCWQVASNSKYLHRINYVQVHFMHVIKRILFLCFHAHVDTLNVLLGIKHIYQHVEVRQHYHNEGVKKITIKMCSILTSSHNTRRA